MRGARGRALQVALVAFVIAAGVRQEASRRHAAVRDRVDVRGGRVQLDVRRLARQSFAAPGLQHPDWLLALVRDAEAARTVLGGLLRQPSDSLV
eukprot:CAMPEP_0195146676 /NCGR_PEP_ID=MMETSP0448-20130528/172016_1 /TAXON_ID=66468 /ORGANISM="Heterocapsa triquestra, Strain CCMP 448" /LENGTH=93 /DNA_ID=CAMNT_0040185231 /DNA_START=148 /DNA_END=426 /DNA_ORIENTATION=-